jgi:zinc protease
MNFLNTMTNMTTTGFHLSRARERSGAAQVRVLPLFHSLRAIAVTLALALLGAAPAQAEIAKDAVRKSIAGIDTVVLKTGVKDVVSVVGSLPAGDDRSPAENAALATLTGMMLDKGTTRQDKFEIAQKLGDVGATLRFSVGATQMQFSGKCLRKDVPLLVSLVAEQLRLPAFSPDEFDKLKRQLVGSMQRQLEDTDFRADDAFSRTSIRPAIPTGRRRPRR